MDAKILANFFFLENYRKNTMFGIGCKLNKPSSDCKTCSNCENLT